MIGCGDGAIGVEMQSSRPGCFRYVISGINCSNTAHQTYKRALHWANCVCVIRKQIKSKEDRKTVCYVIVYIELRTHTRFGTSSDTHYRQC